MGSVFSPAIDLGVHSGGTLLARDTGWPAGTAFKDIAPGTRAAFEIIARVPGEPDKITYRVSVRNHACEVKYPKRQ